MKRRATIVGSGPNGLAAAVSLARLGFAVHVLEAAPTPGGGARTDALTLPGFWHDLASAVHPAAVTSPFFRAFGLDQHVQWVSPEASFAHPLDGGRAAMAWRDLDRTVEGLGRGGGSWRRQIEPLKRSLEDVVDFTGSSLVRWPRHPLVAARFGAAALAHGWGRGGFGGSAEAQALWAGVAAHANTRMPSVAGAAAGLLLAAHAHAPSGWPLPRGGAGAITDALIADLAAHGGEVTCGATITDLSALDWGTAAAGDLLLLAGSPRLALTLPGIPPRYARALARYRYGPAVAKVDLALSGPMPWTAAEVAESATVHVGGSWHEIHASEDAVARGRVSARPYVLVVQPSAFDGSRAPRGQATLWAYLHVPAGSAIDPLPLVMAQLERFAPGIRDLVLASHVSTARDVAASNPAAIGGDVLGGALTVTQAFRRPVLTPSPWRTPIRGVYLASSATPPGPGVNAMAGWYAARTAASDVVGQHIELDDVFPRG